MNNDGTVSGAISPSQQLGAVPGTAMNAVPGLRDMEPGSADGDFASSGEAELAPRANDWDEELSEDVLEDARRANFDATRMPENLDYDGFMESMWQVGGYVEDLEERVSPEAVVPAVRGPSMGPAEGAHGGVLRSQEAIFAQAQTQEGREE